MHSAGQRTPAELIDRFDLACRPIRGRLPRPEVRTILKQFQKQVGLDPDGLLGKKSFSAAWTSPKAAYRR